MTNLTTHALNPSATKNGSVANATMGNVPYSPLQALNTVPASFSDIGSGHNRAITAINTTPASLRTSHPKQSPLMDIQEPLSYHLDEVFYDALENFEETEKWRDSLLDLAPAQREHNANILDCLDADISTALADSKNKTGLLNYAKRTGMEMLQHRLNWLASAATFSPNALWRINKLARWSRFFRSAPTSNKQFTLPNPCKLDDLLNQETNNTYTGLQTIKGNWLQGYPSDTDTPLAVHAHNAKISEVFTRLAMNDCQTGLTDTTENQVPFALEIDGQSFASLNALTDYLESAGYNIEISTASRVADFFGLHYQNPDAKEKAPQPAPLPVFFQANWQGNSAEANSAKATLPVMHSETLLRITPPNQNQNEDPESAKNTQAFEAKLIWLMGVEGIGFKAGGQEKLQAWSHPQEKNLLNGKQAWELVNVMGLLTRALTDIGKEYNIPSDAYFAEGACNDYAGLLQAYAGQPVEAFPLTMPKDFLRDYLTQAINNSGTEKSPAFNHADSARAKRLLAVLETFPSDIYADKNQLTRALKTLPWQENEASPWPAVDRERQKLAML